MFRNGNCTDRAEKGVGSFRYRFIRFEFPFLELTDIFLYILHVNPVTISETSERLNSPAFRGIGILLYV